MPGSEPTAPPAQPPVPLPATYGGPGFVPRAAPHADDVARGELWRRVGAADEVGRLREVALARPPLRLDEVTDPEAAHMLRVPDRAAIAAELDQLALAFAADGVAVHRIDLGPACPPNGLFLRDLVFCTPEGLLLGRPASPVRAGEARPVQAALAAIGAPLLGMPRGAATFEGADALWLDARTVLLGVGRRTNAAGHAWLASALAPLDVEVHALPLPIGVQHLLGVLLMVDHQMAVLDGERAPAALRRLLDARRVRAVELPPDAELREGRAMNGVCLGPGRLLLPAGRPGVRRRLEAAGIEVRWSPMDATLAAAGAMGCLTAVLRRDPCGA